MLRVETKRRWRSLYTCSSCQAQLFIPVRTPWYYGAADQRPFDLGGTKRVPDVLDVLDRRLEVVVEHFLAMDHWLLIIYSSSGDTNEVSRSRLRGERILF